MSAGRAPSAAHAGGKPGRSLVVRAGRMGDVVMITPALRMLLAGRPEDDVQVLTTGEGRRTLRGFDARVTRFHLHTRRWIDGLRDRGRLLAELRAQGFARVYLFESNEHWRKLVSGLGAEVHGLDVPPRSAHYAARCLDVVEPTLVRPVPRGPLELPVTDAGRAAADAYLAAHGLDPADRLVGLHLTFSESGRGLFASGRGRKHREWPLDACAALVRRLVERGAERGVRVRPVLDVLPAERKTAEAFRLRAGDAVTVLSGEPDFERYKALLASLAVLVTPNTGPMHVAAAVGAPVVALFSGWSPEDCGPFVPAERAAVLRSEDTPEADRGLAAIDPEAVLAACEPFVFGARAASTTATSNR